MILYVLRYYPTLTETFVEAEMQGLHAKGLPIAIASFGERGDPGVHVPTLPLFRAPHRWGWLPWLPRMALAWLKRPTFNRRTLWLAALLKKEKVKRVHIHFAAEAAEWAHDACLAQNIPYGLTLHAADIFKARPRLPEILKDAHLRVTISAHNQRLLWERYQVQTQVIPCGVQEQEQSLAPPTQMIAVGRNVPKKGFDTLFAALKGLDRPAQLHFFSNREVPEGIPVLAHGLRPHAEVQARMQQCGLCILPCEEGPDGDMDGIPVVLLEAMAMGLAVITTPISGIPEVIDQRVGWLVPPRDPDALRRAIQDALDHPNDAHQRGQRGRARIMASRSLAQQISAMLTLYSMG